MPSFESISAKVHFVGFEEHEPERCRLQAAFEELMDSRSPTANFLIDLILLTSDGITIEFVPEAFGTTRGEHRVLQLDPAAAESFAYFDESGVAQIYPLALSLAHELVHLLLSKTDEISLYQTHLDGETVRYTNVIHTELGYPERISYDAIIKIARLDDRVLSFTNDVKVDTVVVVDHLRSHAPEDDDPPYRGVYDVDDWRHTPSSYDLIIGSDGSDSIYGGGW